MRRAAGDVDHRQARRRTEILAEQAAFLIAVELQTAGVGDVLAAGNDPTIGATGADGEYVLRACGQIG
jgi:hypothetical protein